MNTTADSPSFKKQIEMNQSRDTEIYFDSVCRKFEFAEYHREQARKVWEALHKIGFQAPSQEFNQFQLAYDANFIAYCQAVHSIADISSQMIYSAVFRSSALREDQIDWRTVRNELKNAPSNGNVVLIQMEAVEKLPQYKNINAIHSHPIAKKS